MHAHEQQHPSLCIRTTCLPPLLPRGTLPRVRLYIDSPVYPAPSDTSSGHTSAKCSFAAHCVPEAPPQHLNPPPNSGDQSVPASQWESVHQYLGGIPTPIHVPISADAASTRNRSNVCESITATIAIVGECHPPTALRLGLCLPPGLF